MKKKITDYDLNNKKVIVRCDFNVPIKEGIIQDDTRIKASLKTINYLLEKNCAIILMSHLGKIKTEEDKLNNTLYPVKERLEKLLKTNIIFSQDTQSNQLTNLAKNLKPKEILLIENTRFEDIEGKKESSCNQELAKYWASLGEIFINDAYGTSHRSHASNVGIATYLPSALGFLVEEEVEKLEQIIEEDTHPFIVIMGGAKVSDKIKVIDNLVKKCDKLLIGGAMAYTFLKAQGKEVGSSIVDIDSLDYCQKVLTAYPEKIILPLDSVIGDTPETKEPQIKKHKDFQKEDIGRDIGPKTIELFKENLKNAKRVILNGTMGQFEYSSFQSGTKEIYKYLKEQNIKTLIGGGDSASSVNKLGFQGSFYHISTGGGATLEYLEGKILPGISSISDK